MRPLEEKPSQPELHFSIYYSIRTRFPALREVVAATTLSSPSLVPRVPSRSRLERLLRRNNIVESSRPIAPLPVEAAAVAAAMAAEAVAELVLPLVAL